VLPGPASAVLPAIWAWEWERCCGLQAQHSVLLRLRQCRLNRWCSNQSNCAGPESPHQPRNDQLRRRYNQQHRRSGRDSRASSTPNRTTAPQQGTPEMNRTIPPCGGVTELENGFWQRRQLWSDNSRVRTGLVRAPQTDGANPLHLLKPTQLKTAAVDDSGRRATASKLSNHPGAAV
jgi:hypothetical protein